MEKVKTNEGREIEEGKKVNEKEKKKRMKK